MVPLISFIQAQAAPAQAPVAPVPPSVDPLPAGFASPDIPDIHISGAELQQRIQEAVQQAASAEEIQVRVMEALEHAGLAQGAGSFDFPFYVPPELIGLVLGALGIILMMIIGYPIARALARRIDRQSAAAATPAIPTAEVLARLERIEHAVETMAVEIERISEGQRYTTRIMSEHLRELGAGTGGGSSGAAK